MLLARLLAVGLATVASAAPLPSTTDDARHDLAALAKTADQATLTKAVLELALDFEHNLNGPVTSQAAPLDQILGSSQAPDAPLQRRSRSNQCADASWAVNYCPSWKAAGYCGYAAFKDTYCRSTCGGCTQGPIPNKGRLEDAVEYRTGCLSGGVAGLRTKALSNMVDYANLQKTKPKADQGWFCDIGEYDENDRSTYTVGGRAVDIMQPCNAESGLAMDKPLVCDNTASSDPSLEKVAGAFAFGTAFFHASGGCVNTKDSSGKPHAGGKTVAKAAHYGDLTPMDMYFAKLLQMLDPNPRFNRVHGKSQQEKEDAQMYASSVRNIDAKIDEFWNIVTQQPVGTWDSKLETLSKSIPPMAVSIAAIGTRVAQTCDSFERGIIKSALEIAAGPGFVAKGYNPDTWRMPVNTQMCDKFLALVPEAIEAFSFQEALFPDALVTAIKVLGLASDSTSGQQFSQYWCPSSDHSRYHMLGADFMRKLTRHIIWMNGIAGTKADVATWNDGTRCGVGTNCRYCRSPETYWVGKLMHACGEEKKWKAGTRCLGGTTCESMCEDGLGYSWWTGAVGHHCGREPCWGSGKICGSGTTCNSCCRGAEAPWYWFGVGKCW